MLNRCDQISPEDLNPSEHYTLNPSSNPVGDHAIGGNEVIDNCHHVWMRTVENLIKAHLDFGSQIMDAINYE